MGGGNPDYRQPGVLSGKNQKQVRAFFQEALAFLSARQDPKTIISAVVHMDEKTTHMHLSFVPLMPDGRLSGKEIVGNRKKLTQWQDEFWAHMVKKFPELERGESASITGRDHIPPRVFRKMTRLTKQKEKLEAMLVVINPLNAKGKAREIGKLLDSFILEVEKMGTQMKNPALCFRLPGRMQNSSGIWRRRKMRWPVFTIRRNPAKSSGTT